MTKKKNRRPTKAQMDEAMATVDRVLGETFSRLIGQESDEQALRGLTAVIMSRLKEAGVNIDPPRFAFKSEHTVVPADRYTAFMMVCAMNNLPIFFNRADCPEVLETAKGTFRVGDDNHIIFTPVKAVDWIEIKFTIDTDGQLKGIK